MYEKSIELLNKAIADELRSENPTLEPFCNKLVRLADDFDFDGIAKLLEE